MSKRKKHKGIMPSFIHSPMGVPQIFMRAMHNSYKAGVFQHDYVARTGARPVKARTMNGLHFLESDAEWIFLIDTDMVWQPEDIITLKQTADKRKLKAVAGWALAIKGPDGGLWPNAYRKRDGGYIPWGDIPAFSDPLKVDAVGGSCFLVHRDIYEELQEKIDGPNPWQDESINPVSGLSIGEDLTFSQRIQDFTDHEIWYEPSAVFYHVKPQTFGPVEYSEFISSLPT